MNRRKKCSAIAKERRLLLRHKKAISLAQLEDSRNLDGLGKIVATGTSCAYRRALKTSDEIVYARDGKIIKQVKGKQAQVIATVSPRKVTKGKIFTI